MRAIINGRIATRKEYNNYKSFCLTVISRIYQVSVNLDSMSSATSRRLMAGDLRAATSACSVGAGAEVDRVNHCSSSLVKQSPDLLRQSLSMA